MDEQLGAVDFAVAAYRDADAWRVEDLTHELLGEVDVLARGLRRLPGPEGAVALIALDDDVFLLVRVTGGRTRLLLSDVTAADEWQLAASALDFLGLPPPEEDDDSAPAGDLDLLGDLGVAAPDLAELVDDEDLYADEILSEVARSAGFGELFDDAVGLSPA